MPDKPAVTATSDTTAVTATSDTTAVPAAPVAAPEPAETAGTTATGAGQPVTSGTAPDSAGSTPETAATADSNGQTDSKDSANGQTGDPADDITERLKASLRGIAGDNRQLRGNNNELRGQVETLTARIAELEGSGAGHTPQEPVPGQPGQPAQTPLEQTATAAPDFYRHTQGVYADAGVALGDARLVGFPFDYNDSTIYTGNPGDLADGGQGEPTRWHTADEVIDLVEARQLKAAMEISQRQAQEAEQRAAVRSVSEQFEKAAGEHIRQQIPGLSDDLQARALRVIQALTAHELGQRQFTEEHLKQLDPGFLNAGAEAIANSVQQFRETIALISRAVNDTQTSAAATAPVPATGSAAVPEGKRTSDMSDSENSSYIRNAWKSFVRGRRESRQGE